MAVACFGFGHFFWVTVIYLDLFLVVLVYDLFYVAHTALALATNYITLDLMLIIE